MVPRSRYVVYDEARAERHVPSYVGDLGFSATHPSLWSTTTAAKTLAY